MSRKRGFEICSGYGGRAVLPVRVTSECAVYDFSIPEDVTIKANSLSDIIYTGVKAYMSGSRVLKLYPRSSLPVKYGVIAVNSSGIIDRDYYNNPTNEGNIGIVLHNLTNEDVTIPAKEKVAQGVFEKKLKSKR